MRGGEGGWSPSWLSALSLLSTSSWWSSNRNLTDGDGKKKSSCGFVARWENSHWVDDRDDPVLFFSVMMIGMIKLMRIINMKRMIPSWNKITMTSKKKRKMINWMIRMILFRIKSQRWARERWYWSSWSLGWTWPGCDQDEDLVDVRDIRDDQEDDQDDHHHHDQHHHLGNGLKKPRRASQGLQSGAKGGKEGTHLDHLRKIQRWVF